MSGGAESRWDQIVLENGGVPSLPTLLRKHIENVYGGSQSRFAEKLGMQRQRISGIVNGRVKLPEEPGLSKIADDLGIPKRYMFVMAGELDARDAGLGADEIILTPTSRRMWEIVDGFPPEERIVIEQIVESMADKIRYRKYLEAEGVDPTKLAADETA